MSNMEFKMTGDKELLAKLSKMASEQDVKAVVKKNTAGMQYEAMRHAPVDTGNLRRSIRVEIKDSGATGVVSSNAEYSGYLENGTRFMAAQPYMRPAFQKYKIFFIDDLKKLVK